MVDPNEVWHYELTKDWNRSVRAGRAYPLPSSGKFGQTTLLSSPLELRTWSLNLRVQYKLREIVFRTKSPLDNGIHFRAGAGGGIQTRGLILGKDALWSAELHPLNEILLCVCKRSFTYFTERKFLLFRTILFRLIRRSHDPCKQWRTGRKPVSPLVQRSMCFDVVARLGLEPRTPASSGRCSTC